MESFSWVNKNWCYSSQIPLCVLHIDLYMYIPYIALVCPQILILLVQSSELNLQKLWKFKDFWYNVIFQATRRFLNSKQIKLVILSKICVAFSEYTTFNEVHYFGHTNDRFVQNSTCIPAIDLYTTVTNWSCHESVKFNEIFETCELIVIW